MSSKLSKGRERETTKNEFLECAGIGLPLMAMPIVGPVNGSEVMIVVCDEQGGACDGRRVGGEGGGGRVGTSVKD